MFFLISFAIFLWAGAAIETVDIRGDNFELIISSYKYLAILLYDDSDLSMALFNQWDIATSLIQSFPTGCGVAQISASSYGVAELISANTIHLPSIQVFRRGVMADYRGPYDARGIAAFLEEDATPSVSRLNSIVDIRTALEGNSLSIVFGIYPESLIDVEGEYSEGYGVDSWNQFVAAADTLRGIADFFVGSSPEIVHSFQVTEDLLPVIFMLPSEGDGFIKYTGAFLESRIVDWALRHSEPAMSELSVATKEGEMYATQFFLSQKLKFILFLPDLETFNSASARDDFLNSWRSISTVYRGAAIFAFVHSTSEGVSELTSYFGIDLALDVPIIGAHDPVSDNRYKSEKLGLNSPTMSKYRDIQNFVSGVVTGKVEKILKSQNESELSDMGARNIFGFNFPSWLSNSPASATSSSSIVSAVGNTVKSIVSEEERDVLLCVYTPWCPKCGDMLPALELLAKSTSAESRFVLAKIDVSRNDIPDSWAVTSYPTLLWFPAKDKPYGRREKDVGSTAKAETPMPQPYWTAGHSLVELISFIRLESSFDPKTLKIASTEQLGSILEEETAVRDSYVQEERRFRCNVGRPEYPKNWGLDFLFGEIVFDGKRWHLLLIISLVLALVGSWVLIISRRINQHGTATATAASDGHSSSSGSHQPTVTGRRSLTGGVGGVKTD